MKCLRHFWMFAFLLLGNVNSAISQATSSGLAESYLQRPVGARAIGFGGAYTAVSNEPNGMFFNPASSAFLSSRPQFSLMVSPMQFGRNQYALSYGQSIQSWGVSASVNSMQSAKFAATNLNGDYLGDFSNEQYDLSIGGSWRNDIFSLGASAKYLINALSGSGASGKTFAFDFGAKVNFIDLFTFGASIQNIGGRIDWNSVNGKDLIPFTIRAGVATEIGINQEEYVVRSTVRGEPETVELPATQYLLIAIDAVYNQYDKVPNIILGAEYSPFELLAVRGGMSVYGEEFNVNKFMPMTQWGAGLTVKPLVSSLPFRFQVDYAVAADNLANGQVGHHLSLVMEF
ncbi:MAG: PorV/PorQ family protein [Ignavibacteria bacterium]|nr:PorV/PorQ family protein [Ignavibacteria bacterium]